METNWLWETIFIQGQFSVARQINFETEQYNEIMHKQKEKDSTEQTENKLYI